MNIVEKTLFIIAGGVIVTIINHLYIKRREKQNEISKYVFQIVNNLRNMELDYNKSLDFFQKNEIESGKNSRSSFLRTYNETYNLIYFYFDEIIKVYISQMKPVVDALYQIEDVYKKRMMKDDLNIKRNIFNEYIYEDQYFVDSEKFFARLYELSKLKLKSPLDTINLMKIDYDSILKYNQYRN